MLEYISVPIQKAEPFQVKYKNFENYTLITNSYGILRRDEQNRRKEPRKKRQMGSKRVSVISRAQKPQRGKPRT